MASYKMAQSERIVDQSTNYKTLCIFGQRDTTSFHIWSLKITLQEEAGALGHPDGAFLLAR